MKKKLFSPCLELIKLTKVQTNKFWVKSGDKTQKYHNSLHLFSSSNKDHIHEPLIIEFS